MHITSKNRARFRREVQEGDKVTYTGVGLKSGHHFQGTVTFPGDRGAEDFLSVMPGGIGGKIQSVDYYRVVEWHKNEGSR